MDDPSHLDDSRATETSYQLEDTMDYTTLSNLLMWLWFDVPVTDMAYSIPYEPTETVPLMTQSYIIDTSTLTLTETPHLDGTIYLI